MPMKSAPVPADETLRLEELRRYDILDTPAEEFYDRLTQLAAEACEAPIALVTLVDADRQWFKSRVGLDATETPRSSAFCAHAILEQQPMVVDDATLDPRFVDNPLVTGAPWIRFYAGVPLVTSANLALGTLCVIDRRPRTLDVRQLSMLKLIAAQVSRELELRLLAIAVEQKSALLIRTQEVAGIGGWSLDVPTRSVRWTDVVYRIHGLTPQSFSPTLDAQLGLYDSTSAGALRSAIEECMRHGTPFDLELSVVRADGAARCLRAIVEARTSPAEVRELIGVFHDITDRKNDALALRSRTERLAMAASAVGFAGWEWTLWDNQLYWDERMYSLYGRTGSGGKEPYALWADSLHPDDRAEAERVFRSAAEVAGPFDTVFRIVLPGGERRVIRSIARTVQDAGTDRRRMIGINQDITEPMAERQAAEAMLKESEHRFRMLFEMSPIGMALVDLERAQILQANNALLEPTQFPRDEMPGKTVWSLLPTGHHALFASIQEELREVGRSGPVEMDLLRRDGTHFPIQLSSMLMKDASGRPVAWSIIQDISQTKAAQAQLSDAARRDKLTGLANRTLFMEKLELAVNRVRDREQERFAVFFLDFDRFKLVNDTLGHDAGDELLRQITQRLRAQLRTSDTREHDPDAGVLSRFGGDEFLLLINQLTASRDAVRVAERLLNALAPPYDIFGSEVHSSASIGIVISDECSGSAEEVVRNADVAMYEAKRAGRACSVVFNESMHTRLTRHVSIETSLRRAIGSADLYLVYQPIIDLVTGRVVSAEALLRWRHPKLGALSPAEFIPIAEESGLIIPVGRWVQQEACRALVRWRTLDPVNAPASISINLSRAELAQSNLLVQLEETLEQAGLPSQCLTLEVTEREVMHDQEACIKLMNELRQMGVKLSMDDFGTGTSSLGMLRNYPFDTIKIDRSFVSDLPGNPDVLAVIHATINLIENLGMISLAEGVETPAQAAVLQSLGCRLAQGYLFSRPVLSEEMLGTISSVTTRVSAGQESIV
jgi:diguanylate cyclase (GGDEF)-like protein/PAS domain S-box-containing protein